MMLGACHAQPIAQDAARVPASFVLYVSDAQLVDADVAALASLLQQAEQRLPQSLKQTIARPIAVEIDHSTAMADITIPDCEPKDSHSTKLPPPQTLGRSIASKHGEPHRILLHPGLIAVARQGFEQSPRFACGHKSLYGLALATVVHEVVHVYDSITKLSSSSVYRNMQQFAPQDALRKIKAHNKLLLRSPDAYEFYDIVENLAVNAEYFLLDPEFKCRRPAVYNWLATHLQHEPFPEYSCTVNSLVYAGNAPVFLDPSRVYQVHYLFAARGKGIASRWGHSMFRVVMCAPHRTRVDEKCLEDLHDHMVLSFVANLRDDLTINAWKGLTGKYVAQVMIRPLTEVLNDYAEFDYRDLQSLPLRMSPEELQQFMLHTLELYWSYGGRYYFLTNNCADESLRLLQTALHQKAVQALSIMTPLGLRDELLRLKVADDSMLANRQEALARGFLFPSALRRYEEQYAKFRDKMPRAAPRRLQSYIKRTKAAERREWALTQVQAPAALSGLFAIEGVILQRLLKEVESIIVIKILFRRDPRYLALGQRLKNYLLSLRQPWDLLRGGYGIPLAHEFTLEQRTVRPSFPEEIIETAMQLVKGDYPDVYAQYLATEQNRKFFLSLILKSSSGSASDRVQSSIAVPLNQPGENR